MVGAELYHGDFRKLGDKIEDGSVSLCYSDPEYAFDKLHLYESLAELCLKKLKPGGHLMVLSSTANLLNTMNACAKYLQYWSLCVLTNENGAGFGTDPNTRVEMRHKPVLWFRRSGGGDLDRFVANRVETILSG